MMRAWPGCFLTSPQSRPNAHCTMSANDADLYEGSLHREAERGADTKLFNVPGGRPDELCVIPKHLPFAKYRGKDGAKDIADEKKLAGYDFYKAGPAESGV